MTQARTMESGMPVFNSVPRLEMYGRGLTSFREHFFLKKWVDATASAM